MAQPDQQREDFLHRKPSTDDLSYVHGIKVNQSRIIRDHDNVQHEPMDEDFQMPSGSKQDRSSHTDSITETRPHSASTRHRSLYTELVVSKPVLLLMVIVTMSSCFLLPYWFIANLVHINGWDEAVTGGAHMNLSKKSPPLVRYQKDSLIDYTFPIASDWYPLNNIAIYCGLVVICCFLYISTSFKRLYSCLHRLLCPEREIDQSHWPFILFCFALIGITYLRNLLRPQYDILDQLFKNSMHLIYTARLVICLYEDINILEGRTKDITEDARSLNRRARISREHSDRLWEQHINQHESHINIESLSFKNFGLNSDSESQEGRLSLHGAGKMVQVSTPLSTAAETKRDVNQNADELPMRVTRAPPNFSIGIYKDKIELRLRLPLIPVGLYQVVASKSKLWLARIMATFKSLGSASPCAPPLEGLTRVEWKCTCGEQLYDDYREIQPQGVANLSNVLSQIENSGNSHPTSSERGFSAVVFSVASTIFGATTKYLIPAKSSKDSKLLAGGLTPSGPLSGWTMVYYLLLCMPVSRWGHKLHQEQFMSNTTSNDRQLFRSLRSAYESRNQFHKSIISIRTITKVYMSQFMVDRAGFVDIRPHEDLCSNTPSADCKCLPPVEKVQPSPNAEYNCEPVPAERAPPLGTNFLTHYFHNPQCLPEDETLTLNQLPKRVRGMLLSLDGSKRTPGWGLVFEEGWDLVKISALLFISSLASLLFGIIWSVIRNDVQGGFTISSYCVSLLTLVLGVFATKQL